MSGTLREAVAFKSAKDNRTKNEELADTLDQLDRTIERCKVMYEQYFMGIQRTAVAASQLHRTAERQIRELTQANIRNTALRFRLTTLTQKFGSYNTYWRRTMRAIENGTYIRDIAKVKRRAERTGEDIPPEILAAMPRRMRERIERDRERLARTKGRTKGGAAAEEKKPAPKKYAHQISEDELAGDFDLDAMFDAITTSMDAKDQEKKRQPDQEAARAAAEKAAAEKVAAARKAAEAKKAAAARAAANRPAPPPAPPGMTEKQTKDLYKRYVQARSLVGESTSNLSYDKLVRTLNKQAPKIMKQHKAKGVDFSVVIKDDKVILKAKPKK
jgi:hypothetical protein